MTVTIEQIEAAIERVVRRIIPEILAGETNAREENRTRPDWMNTTGGQFFGNALLSNNQRRLQEVFGKPQRPSEMVVLIAKTAAERIVSGNQTFADMPDRPGDLLDGDNIWDFMDDNPHLYGVAWKTWPGNERPTYDD